MRRYLSQTKRLHHFKGRNGLRPRPDIPDIPGAVRRERIKRNDRNEKAYILLGRGGLSGIVRERL